MRFYLRMVSLLIKYIPRLRKKHNKNALAWTKELIPSETPRKIFGPKII
jgi:hypothetical protein